jgi:hypothetical protein
MFCKSFQRKINQTFEKRRLKTGKNETLDRVFDAGGCGFMVHVSLDVSEQLVVVGVLVGERVRLVPQLDVVPERAPFEPGCPRLILKMLESLEEN